MDDPTGAKQRRYQRMFGWAFGGGLFVIAVICVVLTIAGTPFFTALLAAAGIVAVMGTMAPLFMTRWKNSK